MCHYYENECYILAQENTPSKTKPAKTYTTQTLGTTHTNLTHKPKVTAKAKNKI